MEDNAILLLYVDGMLIVGPNMQDINALKKKLASSFAIKDFSATKQILGMHITRDKKHEELILYQSEKVLKRFGM